MSASKLHKSRRSMLMLLAIFILPIVLAKLALEQQWFNYGVTNQGQLLANELTLAELGLADKDFQQQWLLLYTLPTHCDQQCENTLVSVNNTYIALGKEMSRVKPVALTQHALNATQSEKIQVNKWRFESMPAMAKAVITHSQVLIVDPLGNVILSHVPPKNAEELPQFGKAILADFKKLLKYSRIG
ncbi:hypothetical protein SAMN05216262_110106 [Colwellia chukchiensis]|uniref:Cytochrome oxidase Cu insertion factor, SCO1/SenC/PrrC family n=1 Tax=Colwellia chukchiensis TaxID=641665 RepID=A0A1H7Q0Q6_9GAMM|nr:hypothetical protein [Colwellia chukchiensis]SEL41543.1 hypothetical protein SAMN05216262_110106 [Colwellia chukchiensis]